MYQVEAARQIIGLVIVPVIVHCIGIDKKSDLAKMMQERQGLLRDTVRPVQEILKEIILFEWSSGDTGPLFSPPTRWSVADRAKTQ